MVRNIVQIDEDLCIGCGACASACHEGAIAMIDGKAKLIRDDYCDGLGHCLPSCPVDAISIIEREADDYDEEAVKQNMAEAEQKSETKKPGADQKEHRCPGSMAREIDGGGASLEQIKQSETTGTETGISRLKQWPVQIKLVPVNAPYFEQANLLIAADCSAFAYAGFHEKFMKNHVTLIGCPKLDEGDYSEKLGEILKRNEIRSVKIVRMEVPCCGGIERAAVEAMKHCGKMIPWQVVTITCDGHIKEDLQQE